MEATFATGREPGFEHPLGPSDSVLAYIDRVCWRLPDIIRAEGGLSLHLDRNPTDPYLIKGEGLPKWRPIQAFVTLTDHYGTNSGGLRVVRGFHREIEEYFAGRGSANSAHPNREVDESFRGEFFRMNPRKYYSLDKRLEPINAPKGSLVCWDNRLPHATCQKLDGWDTREVVYSGFLPNIQLNRDFVAKQLQALRANRPPPGVAQPDLKERCDLDWEEHELTEEQKTLLGIT